MAKKHLRYSDHVDYLLAAIIYLATQSGWWARTPRRMAQELSLDEERLTTVFEGFPGIFRKSASAGPEGQHFFSLQARYAQRDHYGQKEEVTDIRPLDTDKVRLIYDFVQKAVDDERTRWRSLATNGIAAAAAVLSAIAAITAASLRG